MAADVWNEQVAQSYDESSVHMYAPEVLDPAVDFLARHADGRADTFQSPHRFVWPSELDLMAKLADMNLRERWADWAETPFTADSRSHVSVWQRPHD